MQRFSEIYSRQLEFENFLIKKIGRWPGKTLTDFDKKEKTSFSKELALYLYQEVGEFVNAVGNYKMHKTKEDGLESTEIKEEIADMFIFVLDMALTHGMTAEELIKEIESKQDKNVKRQQIGY